MDKDNKTLGLGATVYVQGDPPPQILQLTFFSNNVCPEGLTDEEKAQWVIEEARKLGEVDFQRWKSIIFDKEKSDRKEAEFLKWSIEQREEVFAYEKNQKSDWNRSNMESDALLSHLILEFKQDRLKDGSSIIDWSKPSTPFGWAKRFAPYFKANLCMQLLKSVSQDVSETELLTLQAFPEIDNSLDKQKQVPQLITFESLFLTNEGMELCEQLGEKLGIPQMVQLEKENKNRNRYKSGFVALWQFLKNQRPQIVHDVSDQKACEAIAYRFDAKMGENLWSNAAKDSEKGKAFYKKLEAIMREMQT